MPDYEYRRLTFPAGTDAETARRTLTAEAEYGDWELDRARLWPDGRRVVVVRRRIYRLRPSLVG